MLGDKEDRAAKTHWSGEDEYAASASAPPLEKSAHVNLTS
jgi:hypothetical protein